MRIRNTIFTSSIIICIASPLCWFDAEKDAMCYAKSMSSRKYNFFRELYRELHPGESVTDSRFANPEQWVQAESARLEPIVVSILRGEREDIPWHYALSFAAPLMPTPAVCQEVYARLKAEFSVKLAAKEPLDEREHGHLSNMLSVLALGNDARAIGILNNVLQRNEYSYHIGRKYILAIQRIGDASSLEALRSMPLRQTHDRIDRAAALAEKVIEARIQGRDLFADAVDQLREVNQRFIRAIEAADYEGFAAIQPFEVRAGVDAEEFRSRFKPDDPEIADIIRALKNVAGREQFKIDRDNYQATLVVEDRYEFTYVLEADGWKIFGPVRVAP